MQLEQTLQTFEIEKGLIGEIYTSGLEMYSPSGMGLPKFNAFKPLKIGGPSGFSILKDKFGNPYGIGREEPIDIKGILERIRKPDADKKGVHINYEELIPELAKRGKLTNIHIPLDEKKKK